MNTNVYFREIKFKIFKYLKYLKGGETTVLISGHKTHFTKFHVKYFNANQSTF